MRSVSKTERGWAAHFVGRNECAYHRNTLLECGDVRVIVSTVGNWRPRNGRDYVLCPISSERGQERHYETLTFLAVFEFGYWEIASGSGLDRDGCLGGELDSDLKADAMHERMVDKVTKSLSETGRYE